MHVVLAVAAHVVHVDIEDVGTLFDLRSRQPHQPIPVLRIQHLAAFLRAAGVEAFAHDQERVVLVVGLGAVDRSGGGSVVEGRAWVR